MTTEDVTGISFETETGLKFKVIRVEYYPIEKVSKKFQKILAFKAGYIVAVSYRGTLIPNVTLEEGIARLTSVEVEGKIVDRPRAISNTLGIKESMTAYDLKKVE